ncbi:MAG: hypothetical protein HY775_06090, partial [Acidobacteria bacterium]|nr:hypothetical protein [Acidobacteriota bacterium]
GLALLAFLLWRPDTRPVSPEVESPKPALPASGSRRLRVPPPWSAWWGAAARLPSLRSEAGRARAARAERDWLGARRALAAGAIGAGVWLWAVGFGRGFL